LVTNAQPVSLRGTRTLKSREQHQGMSEIDGLNQSHDVVVFRGNKICLNI